MDQFGAIDKEKTTKFMMRWKTWMKRFLELQRLYGALYCLLYFHGKQSILRKQNLA